MEAAPVSLLGIAGSLRRRSFNRSLMRRAGSLVPQGVSMELFTELGSIPHFNQDSEGDRTPPVVDELRARIDRADALLLSTPEYNGSMPGVLKNALDWASRPPGESVLAGKPCAAIGASPGRYGAQRAQAEVRKVLTAIGARVLGQELPVPRVHELFDDRGVMRDAALERRLTSVVLSLVELARAPAPVELADSAAYSRECQRLAAVG